MYWSQGADDPNMPDLNKRCVSKWKELNSDWEINILDEGSIKDYIPKYFDILGEAKHKRNLVAKSELIRLLLLEKYGGVWSDASVYPMEPLSTFVPKILNETGFFAYRFMKRIHRREIASWFLMTSKPSHSLINHWAREFTNDFLNCGEKWNTGKTGEEVKDPSNYFEVHAALTRLYDNYEEIRKTIDGMVQISEHIPHSRLAEWQKPIDSYMYKRPILKNANIKEA